jgi:hypothetical protein
MVRVMSDALSQMTNTKMWIEQQIGQFAVSQMYQSSWSGLCQMPYRK